MPTARELLEQADALMRRNRARAADTEIPELTEVIVASVPTSAASPLVLDLVPELTEAVEEIEIASIVELPDAVGEASEWPYFDRGASTHPGMAPDSVVALPPTAPAASPQLPVEEVAVAPTAVQSAPVDEWARWEALAAEIRMQVLQRIDIFTDTGLREQLGAQLRPIIDRASAEMVTTINQQVGTLLRAYIAEAIEREIEKWRKGNT